MIPLLRKVSSSRNTLGRIAAIAAAGSCFWYAGSKLDNGSSVVLSIPAALSEPLFLPWQTAHGFTIHPSGAFDHQKLGLSFCSSRVSPAPPSGVEKEKPGDTQKPCPRCLDRDTIANAAADVGPAVVNISVSHGIYGIATAKSMGSGTIIDKDGTILTCAHVVTDFHGPRAASKGKVEVTLQDGRTFEGTVMNADFHSDIAIVKINSKSPLPMAKLGSSSKLRPGDWVVAIGCPLSLQNTVTAGIVSCVDRKSSDLGLGGMRREYLQTDCAINVGNSGGPLVNVDGEVIGVNIMKVDDAVGLSFAVPIDSVSKITEQFKKRGRVIRPWLGLKMIDLNEMIIEQLKERDASFPDVTKGVLVAMVTPGSPASRAGFRPGDVVIEFDKQPVGSIQEIIEIMGDRVGIPLKAVVKRSLNGIITLTVLPEESNPDM
ncbi:putative protease Do-like 14 isoform X2 [Cucurbita moschata]|uniref:Protease Do-like 14 isoform X2 n=1 Tax=Cucurbita moschata TaxID=3662 RepID=A0A6J1FCS0_CUCMO|nr:putative protease Do-like 14 isoform X2 [Cucurbita moschata]